MNIQTIKCCLVLGFAFSTMGTLSSAIAFQGVPPTAVQQKINNLKSSIQSFEKLKEDLKQRIETYSNSLLEAESDLETLESKAEKPGISDESYSEIISTLQGSRVQLLIDLAGLDAKQKAIDSLGEQQKQKSAGSDELLEQLERMYQLQTQNMEELIALAKNGTASQRDVREASIKMIELKIRIIQERQKVNMNPQLVDQLIQISIEVAEKKARLEQVDQMLAEFIDSRDVLLSKKKLQRKIIVIEGSINRSKMEMEQIDHQIAEFTKQINSLENDN